ncbi:MAG: hypothetical protein KJ698_04640 [Actinobacteria bacterium]|nr:hypothetical protein [Actinomycetota bacterium]MBU1492353.1 hypothetical protein [Actinomycetota bacterium]MBU1865285.1 hypothetical protein [Actinomycetota bacterium]
MRRLFCPLLILLSVWPAAAAPATMPPPPIRLGGTWAVSHPCSSPMPVWMVAARCASTAAR